MLLTGVVYNPCLCVDLGLCDADPADGAGEARREVLITVTVAYIPARRLARRVVPRQRVLALVIEIITLYSKSENIESFQTLRVLHSCMCTLQWRYLFLDSESLILEI